MKRLNHFFRCVGMVGVSAFFILSVRTEAAPDSTKTPAPKLSPQSSPGVTAIEDLEREHGILRRIILVYSESADRLLNAPAALPLDKLKNAAELFKSFGEDYHETALEEHNVFPELKKKDTSAADLINVLNEQHNRGRKITAFIIAMCSGQLHRREDTLRLAKALQDFVVMYQHHAAREDTDIFPRWRTTLTPAQYRAEGERFEEIERKKFGEHAFEHARAQIADIEKTLHLFDLSQFTAPQP